MNRFLVIFAAVLLISICESHLLGQNLRQLAQNGDTAAIEKAVQADASALNQIVGNGQTMLMHAVSRGQYKTVQKLLDLGADVNLLNGQQRSVLHLAVMRRDAKMLDLILAANPSLDQVDSGGSTPVVTAIYYGAPNLAKKLLDAGCNASQKNSNGQTLAHIAASYGYNEILKRAIKAGVSVSDVDSNGTTVFMSLCQRGQLELVKEHFNADVIARLDNQRQSCLTLAVSSGNIKLVNYICENSELENIVDQYGNTSLTTACRLNNLSMVEALLKNKADPNLNTTSQNAVSPLLWAVSLQNRELVQVLLDAGADVAKGNVEGNQALHIACGDSLEQWQNIRYGTSRNAGSVEIVKLLLKNKADPNAKNQAGQTPLAVAMVNNFPAGVDSLVKLTREVDIDNGQRSVFHWACETNMPNTVSVLLQREAVAQEINQADGSGRTALCIAAEAGADEIVSMLIENKADPNLASDNGQLPIHCSLQKPGKALEILLAAGASPALADGSGRTPVQVAAWYGNDEAIKLLSKKSVNLSQATPSGSTALHFAAWQGHNSAAKTLVDLGVNVDVKDSDGWTPLHKAAHRGNVEMVSLLLSLGSDKTVTDSIGLTALQKAQPQKREKLESLLK